MANTTKARERSPVNFPTQQDSAQSFGFFQEGADGPTLQAVI